MSKAVEAFRNIGEVAVELGVKKHVLRFWEAKFPQLKPMAELGLIPKSAAKAIWDKGSVAKFDIARIEAIEREVKHDVIAFLTHLAEHVGPEARFVHEQHPRIAFVAVERTPRAYISLLVPIPIPEFKHLQALGKLFSRRTCSRRGRICG